MRLLGLLAFVLVGGCSSPATRDSDYRPSPSPAPPVPFTCEIGELTGTWHIVYTETNGTCGPLADETGTVPTVAPPPTDAAAPHCVFAAQIVSQDKCRMDLDFTCPLAGVEGSQHWVGATHQVSATALSGTMTLTVVEPGRSCRSTYTWVWTQL